MKRIYIAILLLSQRYVTQVGDKPQEIKMVGFKKAEVTYNNRGAANRIIYQNIKHDKGFSVHIPRRKLTRKGVIHEWEDSIKELEGQLMEGQGKYTMQRLKKRRFVDGKPQWIEGKSILITFEGDSLPTRLVIGYGHVWLRVEPFIEAIKQCYKCY